MVYLMEPESNNAGNENQNNDIQSKQEISENSITNCKHFILSKFCHKNRVKIAKQVSAFHFQLTNLFEYISAGSFCNQKWILRVSFLSAPQEFRRLTMLTIFFH